MHRCLMIPEILALICDETEGNGYWNDNGNQINHASLFALARTSRSFREPALASLWAFIPNLIPLIKCVGRDFWKVHTDGHGSELRLTRRISSFDIAVMKKYASLVRKFGAFYPHATLVVAPYVWARLQRILGDAVLFPGLRTLRLNDPHIMKSLSLFTTQYLASVHLSLFEAKSTKEASSRASILVDLSTRCPNLESVNLSGFGEPAEQKAIVAALSNWRNLSRVILSHVTLEALQLLSQHCSNSLRHLTFLRLISSDGIFRPLPAEEHSLTLLALQAMSVGFRDISHATSFMNYLSTPDDLQSLTILILSVEPGQEKEWLGLLHSIKRHSSSLATLDIEEQFQYHNDNRRMVPLSNALTSLIATEFKTLTSISLARVGGYDIVDQDLKNLTEALPLLETFWLVDDTEPRLIEFKTTIACLVFFAQNCPSLSLLYLAFDARADKVPRCIESLVKGLKLRRLDVSVSPVDDPELVATFLFDIFPNIQTIFCEEDQVDIIDDPEVTVEPWLQICELLDEYQNRKESSQT